MKSKKSLRHWYFIVITLGICFTTWAFQQPQQPQKFTCTLTVQEWQTVINAVVSPDDYSNNAKKQISELIQKNMVAVVADSTKKK